MYGRLGCCGHAQFALDFIHNAGFYQLTSYVSRLADRISLSEKTHLVLLISVERKIWTYMSDRKVHSDMCVSGLMADQRWSSLDHSFSIFLPMIAFSVWEKKRRHSIAIFEGVLFFCVTRVPRGLRQLPRNSGVLQLPNYVWFASLRINQTTSFNIVLILSSCTGSNRLRHAVHLERRADHTR